MVHIHINGKVVKAREGEMLLSAIRREGIDVPALCDHPAIEPCGSCRLCTVEITREGWDGWKKYVTSCLYPVEEGLIVTTHSSDVIEMRKTILDLYLARCPNSDVVQKMAESSQSNIQTGGRATANPQPNVSWKTIGAARNDEGAIRWLEQPPGQLFTLDG